MGLELCALTEVDSNCQISDVNHMSIYMYIYITIYYIYIHIDSNRFQFDPSLAFLDFLADDGQENMEPGLAAN